MLSTQQAQEFARDGFLNAGHVLDEAELKQLTSELEGILGKGPDGFGPQEPRPVLFRNLGGDESKPVWQIVNVWEAAPAFEKLLYHPFIVKAISQLTGFGNLQVWHDQVQYKPAGSGGATTWHQDAPAWPSIAPETPVSAWIPFDDADQSNGCMWMVPGSHRWGVQREFLIGAGKLRTLEEFKDLPPFTPPAGDPIGEVKAVPCPVRRGEVHFHHSLTWHGSPMNRSNRPRRAVAIHYMTSESRFVTRRGHPMEQFIAVELGSPMWGAGDHFPIVCRDGEPVGLAPGGRRPAQAAAPGAAGGTWSYGG